MVFSLFCNAVAIGSGIFQFTQAQVYVFAFTGFVYQYVHLAFTNLVIVFELCTLLCYEVVSIKSFNLRLIRYFVCPSSKQELSIIFNFTVLHSISLFYTDLGLIDMLLTNQNAEIDACILLNKKNITRQLEDMNFMFSWQEQYLTRSLRSLVRYCFCHSNIKFISSRYRVISSIII